MLAVTFLGLVFLGCIWSRHRRALLRVATLLAVGPLALFAAYSAWLASAGHSVTYLARTMTNFGSFQGVALTANTTNIWMVLAQAYRRRTQPVARVIGPHYAFVPT